MKSIPSTRSIDHDRFIEGIKYISFHDMSGYSYAAKAYLHGLIKTDIPITWTPMIPGNGWGLGYEPFQGRNIGDPELDSVCNRRTKYDTVIVHLVPEYYPLWIKCEPGKRIIGYAVWETDKPPRHWPLLLNTPDILFVPTQWNKEIFKKWGVTKPIYVIPHIARRAKSSLFPSDAPSWGVRNDDYVFYNIGSWTFRKAIWKTIKCYLDTFSADENTILLIKTSKFDYTKRYLNRFYLHTSLAVKKILKNYINPARVNLIVDDISEEDIINLHACGNCYISLCRSEGWGLGAFDAANFGKPIVITGYGGQVEYLPRQLAYLVDYHLTPVIDKIGKQSYSDDQNWAEPDMAHASQLIRQVFEHKNESHQIGSMLSLHIQENFNENFIIKKLLQAIKQS